MTLPSDEADAQELTAQRVQSEYDRGKQYKEQVKLYERVKVCERFYEGDQWHGLKTLTVRPMTMNFLRRVVSYFASQIVSNDISYEIQPFREDAADSMAADAITAALDRVFERQKLKAKNRESIRDASVDGDAVLYFWFDPDEETGLRGVQGDIIAETVMNTNLVFGNPYSADIQKQPYLLIIRRRPVGEVRREARENGVQSWESITADTADEYKGEEDVAGSGMATEIIRLWKKTARDEDGRTQKSVWFCKVCGNVTLTAPTDTGLSLYPVAYWSWLPKKNSCHGVRPMDEVINTQIAVNRLWTAIRMHIENLAFPKIVYDQAKFPKGWDATPGKAIAINGSVQDALTGQAGGVPLNAMITNVLELMVSTARDFMGASDAALGNISQPDNTSAILAVQNASAAPLELQKLGFYQFVEDYIRVLVDMMHAYYGHREVRVTTHETDPATGQESEATESVLYDFGTMPLSAMEINVEVGEASYWSTILQANNSATMWAANIFPDAVSYLESIPDGLIKNKAALIARLKAKAEAGNAQQMAQGAPPVTAEADMLGAGAQ